jgi:ribosomal protein S1
MATTFKGIVTFVQHEKQFVTIEYQPTGTGKAKTINGQVDKVTQQKLITDKVIKKAHQYCIGDTVQFITKLSDRGDKMIAANIQYLHNEALDMMLNRAKTNNEFAGYIKEVDGKFFVKEINSYRFFVLEMSPWQLPFTTKQLTESVFFGLNNLTRKEKATAQLTQVRYIPEYSQALKLYSSKTVIQAKVCKITDFGMYVQVVNDAIIAKLPDDGKARLNDIIPIRISFINPLKVVVERV